METLRAIWLKQTQGGKPYFCISTKRVKDGQWRDHFFRWPNFAQLEELLEDHPGDKYNLYFCPLPFSRPYRRREYVLGSMMLWADIDNADPRAMSPEPSILWESSPGRWAGLWLMDHWLSGEELENLNKRMTYGTGSDKAGWDITQVLRIPGSRNHKYEGGPRGKLVRMDLKNRLRVEDVPKDVASVGAGTARELYKKWEKKLRGETRSTLAARAGTIGKRSEVLWKLYHQLFDAGVPVDEIRTMVRESVWNKYRGRRDEVKQLDRDIEKCLQEKLSVSVGGGGPALAGAEEIYEGKGMDSVEVGKVDWLWNGYISRGSLTIVEGDPGLGKSFFMQMVGKAVVDGGRLPSDTSLGGRERVGAGSVLYFSVEDDASTVIRPRLVGCRNLKDFRVYDRTLTMDEDGLKHAEYLVEKFKPSLVVFDTINYFIGGIDMHRANEVAQQLEHFTRLAATYNIAVVALRHLTKSSAGNVKAAYRGQGSITFSGTAREVLLVGVHPEDPSLRVVAVTKLNLAARPKAVGYRISRGKGGEAVFEWSDELYDLSSDDIVDVRSKGGAGRPADAREEATKFIEEQLADGPMESDQLRRTAEARGIASATLLRAKKDLKIRSIRRENGGETRWFWGLSE